MLRVHDLLCHEEDVSGPKSIICSVNFKFKIQDICREKREKGKSVGFLVGCAVFLPSFFGTCHFVCSAHRPEVQGGEFGLPESVGLGDFDVFSSSCKVCRVFFFWKTGESVVMSNDAARLVPPLSSPKVDRSPHVHKLGW